MASLPRRIAEGWVNEVYSRGMNQRHPNINRSSRGQPYFVTGKPVRAGQWVRLVVRTTEWVRAGDTYDDHFVFVGTVDHAINEEHVLVTDVVIESEAPAWLDGKWTAVIGYRAEGEARWVLESLEKERRARPAVSPTKKPAKRRHSPSSRGTRSRTRSRTRES
jgi:hypothetical protein